MTPADVTTRLLHDLVSGSHAEGIIDLAVAGAIVHQERILLFLEPGRDFIDDTWQLPVGPVLPGEPLDDTLCRTLAIGGVSIEEFTGYLGYEDQNDTDGDVIRVFFFAITVKDPDKICRNSWTGCRWVDLADLPGLRLPLTELNPDVIISRMGATRPNPDPPLAQPLRAFARGLYPVEAGTELLIGHASWLRRRDFCDGFVDRNVSLSDDPAMAAIDWAAAIAALDAGELPCSSGESRMLRLAASLAAGIPVDLREALSGLDARNANLVSKAVLQIGGFAQPLR
jgi:ADP-ribose pyrophosphatase YjhB (NUDIX family)